MVKFDKAIQAVNYFRPGCDDMQLHLRTAFWARYNEIFRFVHHDMPPFVFYLSDDVLLRLKLTQCLWMRVVEFISSVCDRRKDLFEAGEDKVIQHFLPLQRVFCAANSKTTIIVVPNANAKAIGVI